MMRIVTMLVLAMTLCVLGACKARFASADASNGTTLKATAVAESERAWAESAARDILADIDAGRYGAVWDAGAPALREDVEREDFVRSAIVAREYSGDWGVRRRRTLAFYAGPDRARALQATLVNEVVCGGRTCVERVFLQRIDRGWALVGYSVEPSA